MHQGCLSLGVRAHPKVAHRQTMLICLPEPVSCDCLLGAQQVHLEHLGGGCLGWWKLGDVGHADVGVWENMAWLLPSSDTVGGAVAVHVFERLSGREKGGDTHTHTHTYLPSCLFTLQMAATVKKVLGINQEPGTPSWFPMWVLGFIFCYIPK